MTRQRLRRFSAAALAALLFILASTAGAVYAASEHKLEKKYDVEAATLRIPNDSATIARGRHLARAVTSCTLCHGEDLGGAVYADMGPVGTVAGPNLTRGRGGIGGSRTTQDWVRAIRHGVRADGTSQIMMPSEVFTFLSDEDLASIIAYLEHLPPIDREVPVSHFGPVGRGLLAAGKLNILVAPKTPRITPVAAIEREPTREYGRYLASVAGCHGCHGFGLSGGRVAGPSSLPPASNLTPAALSTWQESDFVRALREGKRLNGSSIDPFMPWQVFSRMTDDELHALWLYLQSVPAKPFGNK